MSASFPGCQFSLDPYGNEIPCVESCPLGDLMARRHELLQALGEDMSSYLHTQSSIECMVDSDTAGVTSITDQLSQPTNEAKSRMDECVLHNRKLTSQALATFGPNTIGGWRRSMAQRLVGQWWMNRQNYRDIKVEGREHLEGRMFNLFGPHDGSKLFAEVVEAVMVLDEFKGRFAIAVKKNRLPVIGLPFSGLEWLAKAFGYVPLLAITKQHRKLAGNEARRAEINKRMIERMAIGSFAFDVCAFWNGGRVPHDDLRGEAGSRVAIGPLLASLQVNKPVRQITVLTLEDGSEKDLLINIAPPFKVSELDGESNRAKITSAQSRIREHYFSVLDANNIQVPAIKQ